MTNLFSLISRVYHFYPIGLKANSSTYPGKLEYKQIVDRKINALINNEATEWSAFSDDIRNSAFPFRDLAYEQSPSYKANFEITKTEINDTQYSKTFDFVISLLTNHYTFFIDECFRYKSKALWHILRLEDLTEDERKFASTIQSKIEKYFPTHEYTNHKLLMDVKIEGGILHIDDDHYPFDTLSLYQYLFEPYLLSAHVTILD